jgi:CheY-like chemotaxis protein
MYSCCVGCFWLRPQAALYVKMSKCILIIDDDEGILEVVRASLETSGGWRVVTARSGKEGLTRAATECPDGILLDVMMPDLDGPATIQQLRANPATRLIPVILLTAKVQAGDRHRLAGLDVQGVISKPFDPLRIAAQISTALGWS